MNYKELIKKIEEVSLNQEFVKSFKDGNSWDINSSQNNEYGMIVLTALPHTLNEINPIFNFNIFYIDKLTKSESNKLDIHNYSIKVIRDIITYLNENEDDIYINLDGISIDFFVEKFSDLCAGGWASIQINLVNSYNTCETLFNVADPVGTWVDLQITNCEDNYPSLINIAIKQYLRMILQPSFDSSSPTNLYNLYYGTENDPTIVLSGTLNNITIQYS